LTARYGHAQPLGNNMAGALDRERPVDNSVVDRSR
jgi:hypothetical protein